MATPAQPAVGPLTYRDLEHTPEDDLHRYEVIDGELVVTPLPTHRHQAAVSELFLIVGHHVRERGLGRVYAPGLMVVLDEHTGLGPDIVFVSKARMAGMHEDGYHGPPDLVVEVLSSKPHLDRRIKFRKYASAGIPHYWIVDPKKRSLAAHRIEGKDYRLVAEPRGEAVFEPELFPGLRIELARLWL